MKLRLHKWTRKAHRYLGLIIGIQFLAWTVGGLYFSWTNLDKVHGEDLLNAPPELDDNFRPAPIEPIIDIATDNAPSRLSRIDFIPLSEEVAVYRISLTDDDGEMVFKLVDASSGRLRDPLSIEESRQIATSRYAGSGELVNEILIDASTGHKEFRGLPLPLHAFTFSDNRKTTVYISPVHPQLVVPRSSTWRIFDFLWMLHTMDYEGRDNFNNYLLKGFSVFGLLTILSGFALFILSSKRFRQFTS